jgi:hypothetical protein
MQLIRTCNHSLGNGVTAGNNQVVRREIKLLHRQWHERKVLSECSMSKGELLKEGSVYWFVQDESTLIRWQKIHKTEQVRLGKAEKDLLKDTVSAGICHQPVMNDSDFQRSILVSTKAIGFSYRGAKCLDLYTEAVNL